MRLADFDYELPNDLIAQTPADRREASRLLVVPSRGPLSHQQFVDLPSLLPEDALLVVNDTRVMQARLHGKKPTGGAVEIFLVEPVTTGAPDTWHCLLRGKTLVDGMTIELIAPRGRAPSTRPPIATLLGQGQVRFDIREGHLDDWGELPLPPYIERSAGPTDDDRARYQTIFARSAGAVAAPTAGLHFTDAIFAALETRGVTRASVTLHVGPGTFAPVRGDDLDAHVMHAERYDVPAATVAAYAKARAEGRPVVAVGTTVVRTLESALDDHGRLKEGPGTTRLFMRPGYRCRAFDLLLTNFHMPKSTLMMLVAAFAGRERVLAAYREAVAQRYRFFSYGDATLLHPEAR